MPSSRKMNLIFETELGETTKIPLNNVKENITLEEVQTAAENLITQNVFFSKSGDLKTFQKAEIITTNIEILE